jgi:hypothetical protein
MNRKEARAWHNRALDYIRSAEAVARAAAAEAGMPKVLTTEVEIGIAIESYADGESQVVVKIQSDDEQTRQAVEVMRGMGAIPEDVRVEFIGPMRGLGPSDRVTPVQPGVCCAHIGGPRGTLGCIVRKTGTPRFLISCNHILAEEDTAELGTAVVQPVSGVDDVREIGVLERAVALAGTGNLMDAAIARLTINDISAIQFNGKTITEIRTAELKTGNRVFKFGQTTFETSATVLSPIVSNIKLDMRFGSYKFDEQIEIDAPAGSPFADGGDSGALVYDEHDRAVGIVIGGNGMTRTYVTPIRRILKEFEVGLA